MLTVKIICIGNLKEKYWRDACAEYAKRLSAFCNFSIVELPEARGGDSEALIQKALDAEATAILAALGGSTAVPLCIEGEKLSSEALSGLIADKALRGVSSLSFIIGSSHGLSGRIKSLHKGVSMSAMTFPHQLARVMLCEQLYRAFQIQNNTKYHK